MDWKTGAVPFWTKSLATVYVLWEWREREKARPRTGVQKEGDAIEE